MNTTRLASSRPVRSAIAAALVGGALAIAAPAVAVAAPADSHPVGGTKDPKYGPPGPSKPAKPTPKKQSPAAPAPEATQKCNEKTEAGEQEVRTTAHKLGRTGPTSFQLYYDTYDVPDTIEVFYEGKRIHTTGKVGEERTVRINVPAGRSDEVVVRVTATEDGTEWEYRVGCPA